MIEVVNLSKTYKTNDASVVALNDLSFKCETGQIIGILGPNGSGKSTLVKILSTVLNRNSGTIKMVNKDIQNLEIYKKTFSVAMQQNSLDLWLSVEENLVIYGKFFDLNKQTFSKSLDDVIDLFGLSDYRYKKVSELSGGYRKRLQLARCFLVDTPIMLLDEPTAGLDPIIKKHIIKLLKEKASNGKTILFTTQIISEAEDLCDKILIINKGIKIAEGSIKEIKKLIVDTQKIEIGFHEITKEIQNKLRELSTLYKFSDIKFINSKAMIIVPLENSGTIIKMIYQQLSPISLITFEPKLEEIFIELLKEEN